MHRVHVLLVCLVSAVLRVCVGAPLHLSTC